MGKVSKELSEDCNHKKLGQYGGRSSRDINGPGENEIKPVGQATEIAEIRDDNDSDGD